MEERKYVGMTYEEVVYHYADLVTRVCLVRCGNMEDAKDCFQDVFLKLYQADKTFSSKEHLKSWLLRVAINQSIDVVRQFWKKNITLKADTQDLDLSVVNVTDEDDSQILGMVLSLSLKYRQVLYMYYYEEYSVIEIADILKIKESTVKSQLQRGRDLLRKKLGGDRFERVI